MTSDLLLPLIMRWLHVGSAVIGVGGTVFSFFILRPVIVAKLSPDQRDAFQTAVMKRWKILFHTLIVVFLVSGFYNFLVVTAPKHEGQGQYHMLFGIKFLLALVVFGAGIVATSSKKWSDNLRNSPVVWWILLLSSLAVVFLGGVMKVMPIADVAN